MSPIAVGLATAVSIVAFGFVVLLGQRLVTHQQSKRRLLTANSDFAVRSPRMSKGGEIALMVVTAVAVTALQGLVLGLIVLVSAVAIRHGIASALEQKRNSVFERNLPLCLDSVARSLRSGAGILPALVEAGSATAGVVGEDVSIVAREVSMGRSISEALEAWSVRRPLESVRLCTGAMTLALETGAAQAQVVDSIAANLRQHLNSTAMAKSAATEYQMSSVVLSVLPLVICVPTVLLNEDARQFMLHTTIGSAFFVAGLVLDAAGFIWMSQMIKRATR